MAAEHVKQAFASVAQVLRAEQTRPTRQCVPIVLALAGTDAEDHHATMCCAHALLRKEIADSCAALIRPMDLDSVANANRRICEQLIRAESSSRPQGHESDEDDEDDSGVSASHFVEWWRANGRGMTVLFVESADAAPKDVLRDVLCYWHANCINSAIPLVAILGLKQLPASRAAIFELGAESLAFVHLHTECLFDANKVFEQLLDNMVEDGACPWALSPDVVKRLREIFLLHKQSVSHFLRLVCLLCDTALADKPMSWLCEPLAKPERMPDRGKHQEMIERELTLRCKARQASQDSQDAKVSKKCSEQDLASAAKAIAWRWGFTRSLELFDVLFVGAFGMGHCARLRRYHCLLEALWPLPAEQEAQRKQSLDDVVHNMQVQLDCLPVHNLPGLLEKLVTAAAGMSSFIQAQVKDLLEKAKNLLQATSPDGSVAGEKGLTRKQLRKDFKDWIDVVRTEYWTPLTGPARDIFLADGSLNCTKASLDAAESHLLSKTEVKLQRVAAGVLEGKVGNGAAKSLSDAARLFQYLECCAGKQIKVADLWSAFLRCMNPSAAGEDPSSMVMFSVEVQATKRRFQQALITLHLRGIFAPASGGAQKGLSGWRLRRRTFGRVWLRQEAPKFQAKVCPPSIQYTEEAVDTPPRRPRPQMEPLSPPCSSLPSPMSRIPGAPPVGSPSPGSLEPGPGKKFLKRLPFPAVNPVSSGNDSPECIPQKKRRGEKIYYGPIDCD